MAPKPSGRRRSRERDPELPTSRANLINFQKPNLPPLQSTPSSRRQYSYGAGLEPATSRLGRQSRPVDLATAVRGALTSHDDEPLDYAEEEDQDDESNSRQQSRQLSYPADDGDELAGSEADFRPRASMADQRAERTGSRPPSNAAELLRPAPRAWSPDGSEADDARSFVMENDYYGEATIDSSPRPIPPPTSIFPTSKTPLRQKLAGKRLQSFEPDAARVRNLASENDSEKSNGVDTDATVPKSTWKSVKNLLIGKNIFAPASPPESDAQLATRSVDKDGITQQAADNSEANERREPRRQLRISPESSGLGLFSRAPERENTLDPCSTTSRYRSDHSEMDNAMQRDIEESAEDVARQRRVHGPDDSAIDLWQLLNPLTHLQAVLWFFRSVGDNIADALSPTITDPVRNHLTLVGGSLLYLIAGTLTVLMTIALSQVAIERLDLADFVAAPSVSTPSWPGFGAITGKIGDYIPSMPWSSRSPWGDFPDLANMSHREHADFEDWLKNINRDLLLLKEARKLHEASIKKLESIVPKLVHMNLKNGKPVVAQEFWHAIRDLIHQDGSFLTLEKKRGGVYEVSSERQWKAIAAQLSKDPVFTSQWNLSLREMEDRLNGKMSFFWDTWVANNQRKISQMLGLDKRKPVGSQEELDKQIDDKIKKHLTNSKNNKKADGVVVTRGEFLRHLNNEFATHRAEMKAELGELQPKLEKLVRESIELANNDVPSGMTRSEVEKLVSGLVRKAVADANLEAMAKGRIHAHWDQDLKNQVNYFGPGAGAIVDPNHSSKSFEPDEAFLDMRGVKSLKPLEPKVALQPWYDDGDCWCAARDLNPRGNPHGVYLSVLMGHTIIPRHIVIEHILPGATLDPGARPRHIEVYASIEDRIVRERVLDFASAHFPDDESDWNFTRATLPDRFVQIGQFIYEGAELHEGVLVHRLSSELTALGVETDQVVVRAVSNYGAAKYTCFYRVRLYGDTVETPSEK